MSAHCHTIDLDGQASTYLSLEDRPVWSTLNCGPGLEPPLRERP